jgi:hypothetical protein
MGTVHVESFRVLEYALKYVFFVIDTWPLKHDVPADVLDHLADPAIAHMHSKKMFIALPHRVRSL